MAGNRGEAHYGWKGDDVTYKSLHIWVNRNFSRPTSCEFCGAGDKLEWANKSGSYKRDRQDWLRLCRPCHRNYDAASYEGKRFTGHKHTEESKAKTRATLLANYSGEKGAEIRLKISEGVRRYHESNN